MKKNTSSDLDASQTRSDDVKSYPVDGKVTDEVLIALKNGEHQAYDIVYMTYKDSLEVFLLKLTGSLDDAKDILQQIFIILWCKRADIDPSRSIKGYLFTIAKNTTFKFFKEKKKHQGVPSFIETQPIPDSILPDDNMIAEDTRLLLEIAVSNMPKQRMEVYRLSFEGLSYEEIAARLQITPENARKHLSLARKQLEDILRLIIVFFLIKA